MARDAVFLWHALTVRRRQGIIPSPLGDLEGESFLDVPNWDCFWEPPSLLVEATGAVLRLHLRWCSSPLQALIYHLHFKKATSFP